MPFLAEAQSQKVNEETLDIENKYLPNLYESDDLHFPSSSAESQSESEGFQDIVKNSLLSSSLPVRDEEFKDSSDSSSHSRDDSGSNRAAQCKEIPPNDSAIRSEIIVRTCGLNAISFLISFALSEQYIISDWFIV